MVSHSAESSMPAISDAQLDAIGHVSASYRHHQRLVAPLAPLAIGGAVLKWSAVSLPHEPVTPELEAVARDLVVAELAAGHVDFPYGMGFVVLHHSEQLDYLIVASWREHQEMWATMYTRPAGSEEPFAPVAQGTHNPIMCAWELAPVWHERDSWVRYLESDRDIPARRAWLEDQLAGLV